MMALVAILVDTYRELASKRLFWLSLALSGLVVLCFAAVGINERGLQLLGWTIEIPLLNSSVLAPEDFYKLTFYTLGVRVWLSWLACLLALVSSAGLFPELVSSGTVETLLARPIARWRLYVFRFAGGLLFTAMQLLAFCLASFLVIGLRGGVWEPGLFLAVPMVTLVYSYLFAACALIGTLTRSGIAALLLTVLLWGLLFTLNTSETIVDGFRVAKVEEVAAIDRFADRRVQKDPQADVSDLEEARERAEEALDSLRTAHRILFTLKTVLPKPEETAALVERWLVDAANLRGVASDASEDDEPSDDEISRRRRGRNSSFGSVYARERDVIEAVNRERRSRGAGWIVGTSLGFEAVVILAGCLVFARRDF
jgi:ABC-type transport system involved in multi-copper enzyme maturation permease subunit